MLNWVLIFLRCDISTPKWHGGDEDDDCIDDGECEGSDNDDAPKKCCDDDDDDGDDDDDDGDGDGDDDDDDDDDEEHESSMSDGFSCSSLSISESKASFIH